jgi:3-dehydrosphinganine reductase
MEHLVITGGSSGIGLAIAGLVIARGGRVTLIARDPARLAEAAETLGRTQADAAQRVAVRPADVTDADAARAAILDARERHGPLHGLVASAGIVHPGRFDEQSAETFDRQIAVNLTGAANCVRAAYPLLKAQGGGRILLIGSGAGMLGIYGYSAYCASKFALRGFAEALRAEARLDGISVSLCSPPDTDTPQLAAELPSRPPEAALTIGAAGRWPAHAVAKAALAGMDNGRFIIDPGPQLKMLGLFGSMVGPLMRRLSDRRIDALRRSTRAGGD